MKQTWLEKWRDRFIGAWAVLAGRAYAGYYEAEINYANLSDFGLEGFAKRTHDQPIGGIDQGPTFWKNSGGTNAPTPRPSPSDKTKV